MNPMQHMKDPAAGLAPQLLPHLHLISKYRYPITNNPSLETIVGYLLEAQKIVRELQPMQWQYLDGPPDGTLMLAWQPLEYLGTSFASDGYVYGDAEQVFKSDVRGYTLEMFLHRSGYRAQGEPMASHSRRRYRLLPGNPSLPSPDPSLFIIHYSKASQRDHVPAASIPIMPHIHAQITQRRVIQSQGQLARKEFMLHDRSNWPTISAPQSVARSAQPGQIAHPAGHRRGTSIAANEATLEEEEDVSRGDVLDFMTPRDISRVRYEQHHEWMEEILETPYNMSQIIPGDLGLGRKGELEELTKDFFDAPVTALRESIGNAPPPRVGRLASGKADEFANRASQKLADMQAELDRMNQKHKQRMEKLQRTTILNTAERKLRTTPHAASGRSMSSGSLGGQIPADPVDEIANEVEAALGKKIDRITNVTCVARGGLEDRYTNVSLTNGNSAKPATSSEKGEAEGAGPDNAVPQENESETLEQPQNINQPDSEGPDKPTANSSESQPSSADELNFGDDSGDQGMIPDEDDNMEQHDGELPSLDDMGMDVDMSGLVDDQEEETANLGGNDWVMVDEDKAPGTVDGHEALTSEQQQDAPVPQPQVEAESKPVETTQSQPAHEEVSRPLEDDQNLDVNEFDMGAEFDTAGDALASYGDDDDDLNLDNMDDSEFGDAFH